MSDVPRDRDAAGNARNARPRDRLGKPLARSGSPAPVAPDGPALQPAAALARAQWLLNSCRPFEAHEVFEDVWKSTRGDQRDLWRGLAQLAVGMTHALRGNTSGASALLQRSAASLAPYAGTSTAGVDIDGLRSWASAAAADLTLVSKPPRLTV